LGIPLFEPSWGKEETDAVTKAIQEGQLNEGKYVREFEKLFADFVKAKYCIFVPNGALALWLGIKQWTDENATAWLKDMPIRVGDYYGIFAANAVRMLNKQVHIVDTANCGCGTTDSVFLTIPIHVNGRLAKATQIEDSCQAITHHTKHAISCYSFHPSKQITCGGIGGAVCCDDEEQYVAMSAIKDHGRPERATGKPISEHHLLEGTNLKMSDLNAAFGIEQLKRLPERIDKFNKNYKIYKDILGNKVEWFEDAPTWRVDCKVNNPTQVIAGLANDGIHAKRFYIPLHRQEQFLDDDKKYPNCMALYEHGLYLPSSPNLTENDIQQVCASLVKSLD